MIEGTTEMVLQFMKELNSIYDKNLCLIEQKNVFLNYTVRFKEEKNTFDSQDFCH
jgi:hypothetical protein